MREERPATPQRGEYQFLTGRSHSFGDLIPINPVALARQEQSESPQVDLFRLQPKHHRGEGGITDPKIARPTAI
jgi:hypothetical protein